MDTELIREPDEHDLVYIGANGTPWYANFMGQATTDQIASFKLDDDRYVLQQISKVWEVYDLGTLKPYMGGYTIGIPKFTHEDFDAAMMWALMNL